MTCPVAAAAAAQNNAELAELWLGRNRISQIENLEHMSHLQRMSLQSNRCAVPWPFFGLPCAAVWTPSILVCSAAHLPNSSRSLLCTNSRILHHGSASSQMDYVRLPAYLGGCCWCAGWRVWLVCRSALPLWSCTSATMASGPWTVDSHNSHNSRCVARVRVCVES